MDDLIETLRADIERLRKTLEQASAETSGVNSSELLRLSTELDHLIVRFHQLTGEA
jgi:capsule polysaccharide export protein KpsE/RkpR